MKLTIKQNIPGGVLPDAGVLRLSKTLPGPLDTLVGVSGTWGIPVGGMGSLLDKMATLSKHHIPMPLVENTKYIVKFMFKTDWLTKLHCIISVDTNNKS